MSSDRTRNSYDPRQKYGSLVFQAGRVLTDPDLSEAQDLLDESIGANTCDVIGPYGSPDEGFEITAPTGSGATRTFNITAGTMYIGGQRLTLEEDIDYFGRDASDGVDKLLGQKHLDWVTIPMALATFGDLEHVHLHVLEKEVGAVEDQALREVALGGPDTSNRKRLVQRVKRVNVISSDCFVAWNEVKTHYKGLGYTLDEKTMLLEPDANLLVEFTDDDTEVGDCEPEAHGGYLGAENQMIRVKIVEFDDGTKKAKILWSYDNASHIYRVKPEDDGTGTFTKLTLSEKPVDTFHWPIKDQAVEILRTGVFLANGEYVAEHMGAVGIIDEGYDVESKSVTLTTALPNADFPSADADPPIFMRVWNEQLEVDIDPSVPVILGKTGIEVTIERTSSSLTLPVGVFWTFAVRPTTPNEIYPKRYMDGPQPPEGPREWIAPLATIDWTNVANPIAYDCRGRFVPLTEVLAMYFVEGESQEVMPDPLSPGLLTLDVKPKVGVARGINREPNAKVKFTITKGGGQIVGDSTVVTGPEGTAECNWEVDSTTDVQQLTAELLDEDGTTTHIPLVFTVQLSRASLVAFDPGTCPRFAGSVTVQAALDDLCIIPADTVTYDPSNCDKLSGKITVQDAIDELCKQESGCCTVRVNPEDAPDLQKIIDDLAQRRNKDDHVSVCFSPGEYRLEHPLVITRQHSNFTFEGCPGGVVLVPKSANLEFLPGLVLVVQASNITFQNLRFLPRAITLNYKKDFSYRFAIGLSVQQSVSLTVRQCVFELPTRSDDPLFFFIGLYVTGDQEFLVIEACSFVQGILGIFADQTESPIRVVAGILAITSITYLKQGSNAGSAAVVLSELDRCTIEDNEFYGLSHAAYLLVGFGSVRIVGNRVRECFSGFTAVDIHTAQVKQAILKASVPASIQDAVKDKLGSYLKIEQDPQLMVALEIAKGMPVHSSFDLKGVPTVAKKDLDKDAVVSKKFAQYLTDSLIQSELETIPKGSKASKRVSVKDVVELEAESPKEEVPAISSLKLRNARILSHVFFSSKFSPSKVANLFVSGNDFSCIVGPNKLSDRCMNLQSSAQAPGTIRFEGNSLVNRAILSNVQTLRISDFDYVTVTGNHIKNELSRMISKGPVKILLGGSFRLLPEGIPSSTSMLAVTGNCFHGYTNLAVHPRPGYSQADGKLSTWEFANHMQI